MSTMRNRVADIECCFQKLALFLCDEFLFERIKFLIKSANIRDLIGHYHIQQRACTHCCQTSIVRMECGINLGEQVRQAEFNWNIHRKFTNPTWLAARDWWRKILDDRIFVF